MYPQRDKPSSRYIITRIYVNSPREVQIRHDFGCISSLSVNKRQRAQELYFACLFQNDGVLDENIFY